MVLPKLFFFLFFSISLIYAQEGFLTQSLSDLTRQTDDVKKVFLNQTCLSFITLPDYYSPQLNLNLTKIKFTPKSMDLSNQNVETDASTTTIKFSGDNAILGLSFSYLWALANETRKGNVIGQLSLTNITNFKQITLTNNKAQFFTTSMIIQSMNLTLDTSEDANITDTFMAYYQKQSSLIIYVLINNMTNCLNKWLYTLQSQQFFAPYQYSTQGKFINYTYKLTNLFFGQNFFGIWYNANIFNFTRSRIIPLSPTNTFKALTNNSQSFLSKSIFLNTINYAMEQKMLDFNLNEFEYKSDHFDYFIGEIALFVPEIRKAFYSDEKISGFCKVSNIYNATFDFLENYGLFVALPYFCSINERNTQTNIFNFSVHLNYTLTGSVQNKILDFSIDSVKVVENSFLVQEKPEFPHTKRYLWDYHLNAFIQEMLKTKTLGSNFNVQGDSISFLKDQIVITALSQFN